jgi:GNAT superfamily N-acetyltransferase
MTVPQTTLVFRKATPHDIPAILTLVQSAYRGESSRAGWTTEADILEGDRIDHAGVLAKIQEPASTILLAHDSAGALASCCELVKRNDDMGYFGLFAVDPLRQGGGIGKQVMRYAERYARETLGVRRMEMWVIFLREEIIAYYARQGYVDTGRTEPFPYNGLPPSAKVLRDDLYFVVLCKDL